MKPKSMSFATALFVCVSLAATPSATAAKTWTGSASGDWANTANWLEGALPGTTETVIFNASSTGTLSIDTGAIRTIRGIDLTNPAGAVTIANNTLTIGDAGINMSAATADLTLNCGVSLAGAVTQDWTVASGRVLAISGALGRAAGGVAFLDTTAGGTISLPGVAASSRLSYATLNGVDVAAVDALGNVANATSVFSYTNPNGGNISGVNPPVVGVDVQTTTAGSAQAYRHSNAVTITNGVRFNAANTQNTSWTVDTSSSGRLGTLPHIIVTANVGAQNITYGGSGGIRTSTSGGELFLHQLNPDGALIFNTGISNNNSASALTKTGPGTVIIASNSGYTGTTRINEGIFQLGNNGTSGGVGSTAIINYGTLAFKRSDTVAAGYTISGTGDVVQLGTGVLSLTGTNSYTGPTRCLNGLISFNTSANLGSGTEVVFDGGGVQWNANTTDISSRTLTLNAGGGTLDTNGNDITLANPVGNGGSGALTKAGTGTLTLSAANDYTGGTSVAGGKLVAANASGSATGPGAVTVAASGTLGGTGSIAGTVSVATGGTLEPGAGVGDLSVGGLALAAGSAVKIEFNNLPDNDRVLVTASNGLTIDGGQVHLFEEGTSNPFNTVGTYDLFTFAGSIQGTGVSALSVSNPALGFDYSFGVSGNVVQVTIAIGGIIRDWITDGGGAWTDGGSWNGAVPGTASDTVRFNTLLTSPATITLDAARTVGGIVFDSSPHGYTLAPGTGGSLVFDNGSNPAGITIAAGSHAITAPVSLTSDLIVSTTLASETLSLTGNLAGSGSLTMAGPGTLVLTGTNTTTAGIQLAGGTVEFATGSLGSNALTFTGGRLRWAAGNADDISSTGVTFGLGGGILDTNGNNITLAANNLGNNGIGSLTKEGAGVLTLNGINTYNGPTQILGGTLAVGFNDNLGSEATGAGITLDGGTLAATQTLALDQAGANQRPLTLGAGGATLDVAPGAVLTVSGGVTGSVPLTKTGDGTLVLSANNTATLTGGVVADGGTLQVSALSGTSGFGTGPVTLNHNAILDLGPRNMGPQLIVNGSNGLLSGDAGGQSGLQVVSGPGTLDVTISGANVDLRNSLASMTGTLRIASAGGNFRFNGSGGSASVTIDLGTGTGSTTSRTGATNLTIGELLGGSNTTLGGPTNNAVALVWTVGGKNTSSQFDGRIIDGNAAGSSTGLSKVGTGTLTLTGASTFTGTTTVSGGTLAVASATALGSDAGPTAVSGGDTDARVTLPGAITLSEPWTLAGRQGANVDSPALVSLADGTILTGSVTFATGGNAYNVASDAGLLTMQGDCTATGPATGDRFLQLSGSGNGAWTGAISDGTAVITIVKQGSGTWTLSGANAYTGETRVDQGTLSITGAASLHDDSTVRITTGAQLHLDFTGGDRVAAFYIDGTPVADGIWGAIGSGAPNVSATLTGSGLLYVNTSLSGSPYETWAAGTFARPFTQTNPGDDQEGDGLANLLEFVLGGDPTISQPDIAPKAVSSGTNLVITFKRSDESELDPAVAARVQVTADLAAWNPADDIVIGATNGSGPNGASYTVSENGLAPDDITVTIPKGSNAKLFARVIAEN
jgi:autotransporter-associated beta strand protein